MPTPLPFDPSQVISITSVEDSPKHGKGMVRLTCRYGDNAAYVHVCTTTEANAIIADFVKAPRFADKRAK